MNFNQLKNSNSVLRSEEMSKIKGGKSGTCGFLSPSGTYDCGMSKAEAIFMAAGGHWCCDSCSTSSYCG
ncbi:MAG: rSAM-modified peptide [Bacteroidales bacterium]